MLKQFVELWLNHQRIALASAILSSLWAPSCLLPPESMVGENERF
jgi:hypothetical protein